MNEAGYLTPEGKLLDFSGRKQGNTYARGRALDHRDINSVLPEDDAELNRLESESEGSSSVGMRWFMDRGNIRLQTDGINLSKKPTDKQKKVIARHIRENMGESFYVDITNKDGIILKNISYEYPNVSIRKILSEIDEHFERANNG